MARGRKPKQVEEEINLRDQIELFCIEKGLEFDEVMSAIERAIAGAYRREFGDKEKLYEAEYDLETNNYKVFEVQRVVDEVLNEEKEVTLVDARLENPSIALGDSLRKDLGVEKEVGFGRIASQVAKQVLIFSINNIKHAKVLAKYKDYIGQIVPVEVDAFKKGGYIVKLDSTTSYMKREDILPTDRFKPGQVIKALIVDIEEDPAKGSKIHLTRSMNEFILAIIKKEVPEVESGLVKLDKIVREAGNRTKILVSVNDEDEARDIDPVGTILGRRNVRIINIMREVSTSMIEKIDIVENSPGDLEAMIEDALEPAQVERIELKEVEGGIVADVYCMPEESSLAVGKRGANVRLASQLLDIEINIHSLDPDEYESEGPEIIID